MWRQFVPFLFNSFLFLLIDGYLYKALRRLPALQKRHLGFRAIWWSLSAFALTSLFLIMYGNLNKFSETVFSAVPLVFLITKLTLVPFLVIDDIKRLITWLAANILRQPERKEEHSEPALAKMPRSTFLVQAGLVAAAIPLSALTKGIISGAYDYEIKRVKLYINDLPGSFEGIKVAQISDIHSGSFYNRIAVQGGVDMLMQEKPDMVFFTGDLVNDLASEMKDYQSIFSKVKAPLGVYSVLGNHDYGDYHFGRFQFGQSDRFSREENFRHIIQTHKNMGWDLLLNAHRKVKVDNDEIAIIGVENWGLNNKNNYGKLDVASKNLGDFPVKLLLSHDPSHWRAEVLKGYPQIDVVFSGHTHGGQFGVQTEAIQWSPVQYRYQEWAGLYQENHQQLYVNVGYGFMGYPGRVGILPEITMFELRRA